MSKPSEVTLPEIKWPIQSQKRLFSVGAYEVDICLTVVKDFKEVGICFPITRNWQQGDPVDVGAMLNPTFGKSTFITTVHSLEDVKRVIEEDMKKPKRN